MNRFGKVLLSLELFHVNFFSKICSSSNSPLRKIQKKISKYWIFIMREWYSSSNAASVNKNVLLKLGFNRFTSNSSNSRQFLPKSAYTFHFSYRWLKSGTTIRSTFEFSNICRVWLVTWATVFRVTCLTAITNDFWNWWCSSETMFWCRSTFIH